MVSKTEQDSLKSFILIGRCNCDSVLNPPYYWCEEIINKAVELNFNIIDLKKEKFIEEKFKKCIEEHSPEFIFLNGHGDEYSAMGYQKNPVLIVNKNEYLLKDKKAHIISCKTACYLGPLAMDKGCKGYIGHNNRFLINPSIDPSKDIISKFLMEAVNIVSITLMEGGSLKEAYEKSQKVYEKHIEYCLNRFLDNNTSDIQKEYLFKSLGILRNNKKCQVYRV